MAVEYNHAVDIRLEEEKLLITNKSKKAALSGRGQQHIASKITLQDKLASQVRKKRGSDSVKVESLQRNVVVAKKKCMNCLLEPEQATGHCVIATKSLRKKQKVKPGPREEYKNLNKDRSLVVELKSQKVVESLQESDPSESGTPKIMWNLRKRTEPICPELLKACKNPNKNQSTKRRGKPSKQSQSFLKYKEKKSCKSQVQSPENCTESPVEARWSVPHISNSGLVNGYGTESQTNSLMKPQEPERKGQNFSVALTLTKVVESVEFAEQYSSQCLLKCVADCVEDKKCGSSVEEMHRMVTKACLKSKMCEHDSEKLNRKPQVPIGETADCKKGISGNNMVIKQMVDCWTEDMLITSDGKKHIGGKDEFLTSAELKKEISTSRKQIVDVSSIQQEKLSETDLTISHDCSIQNHIEQSTDFPVSKSDETENKTPVSLQFEKDSEINCSAVSCPVTNTKCPQPLDIKVAEKKSGVYQDEGAEWLSKHSDSSRRAERIPVVRLYDCCYIKDLLKPIGIKTLQNDRVHFGSLKVVRDQRKVLSPCRGMGQNDSSSNPTIVQPANSLPEKNILVGKEIRQNSSKLSEYQNGKRFRESKWSMNFKKPSKRIRISENLEISAVQKVFTNKNVQGHCGLQIKEGPGTVDSKVLEEVKCETTCLSSLNNTSDLLELSQTLQNQITSLPNSEKMREACFVTCNTSNFENSSVLRKSENVLELESTEPQIDFHNKVNDTNSLVESMDSGNITNCDSNATSRVQRGERAPIMTRTSKTGRNLQLYSCQRTVPISGKNRWPRESCARTSLWVQKNNVTDIERRFLRSTDSSINSGEAELHKALAEISKALADNIMDPNTQKSPASESVFCINKVNSIFDNENRFSSTGMDRHKQCTSNAKIGKQSKMASKSLEKNVKSKRIVKSKRLTDNQSGTPMSAKEGTNDQKTSVVKEKPLRKTLITGNLSNFKIPLLKDRSESIKMEYATSSEKGVCSLPNILEDSTASVKNIKAEEALSAHQFRHQQATDTNLLEEHKDQLNSEVPENFLKEKSAYKDGTSDDSKLEIPHWKENPSLSAARIENQMDTVLALKMKGEDNYSDNVSQENGNFGTDVCKAYEDDVLVIDVIQDDPDLFGDIEERESACTEELYTENDSATVFSEQKVMLEPDSPQLPGSSHLKLYPRESPIQDYVTTKSVTDVPLTEVDEIKLDSLSRISSVGGITESSVKDEQLIESDELIKSCCGDEKYKMIAVKEEKANSQNAVKIENAQCIEPVSHDCQLELSFPVMKSSGLHLQNTTVKPWRNDCRLLRKDTHLPSSHPTNYNAWKNDKGMTNLGLNHIPRGYCRLYFNTLKGCQRTNCWYWHVPAPGNEKFFNETLKKYISIGEVVLLQRAARMFTDFYKEGIPWVHLSSQVLDELLISLIQSCLLKELFNVLHTSITIKMLPTVDILLKMYEQVASVKIKEVVPDLIDISYKLVDAGMVLEYEHIGGIIKFLNQLQLPSQEITTFISRFQGTYFHKASLCDFNSAIAEFQHCKEKGDWARLGTLFVNVRRGCENIDELEKYSSCIANILTSVVKEERPTIPFCEFAAAVNADAHHNKTDTTLGMIGISVIFSYYRKQQWLKARKVLDLLHTLRLPYTFLKGPLGQDRFVSRCRIINVAVEIFLKYGNLDGAICLLRETQWVINSLSWPCDRMDVISRHNLLCAMASEYITKNQHVEAFEVLRNLPGFQTSCESVDVSQYNSLFNNLLRACLDNEHFMISSSVTEFMLAKNIAVDFKLLRALITSLGKSCWLVKARTHYKSALQLGCYPPLEGNLYHKSLLIPSYMSEIEMLLAIEIFLVSNASSIQSPGAFSQRLQIILKRCEGYSIRQEDDYQNATVRLIQAGCISSPKLFIKLLTVNVNMEQVYHLEYASALKWLKNNMKWAGKAWLF